MSMLDCPAPLGVLYSEWEDTINLLTDYHHRHSEVLEHTTIGKAHTMWIGDFNRHHPLWDSPTNMQLFTNTATEAAEKLIEVVTDAGLELALSNSIPMHKHNITKYCTAI
jgi:hypothetical protein